MSTRYARSLGVSLLGLVWTSLAFTAFAQAGNTEESIPPLRPPKPELPAGWWEQHGLWVLASVLVLLTLSTVVALLLLRLRKPDVPQPVRRAHQELEPLLEKAEDGIVLTRASQAVKGYFQSVFSLPQGELTTTEFCNAVSAETHVGPQLGSAVGDFLRRCDQKKFAPAASPEPLNAVRTALDLVDSGEQRRMQLAQEAEKVQPA